MLREDLEMPNKFKNKFTEFMHTIKPDYVFDAPRFVIEELTEYVDNAADGGHEKTPELLIDDICDTLWCCSQASNSYGFLDKVYSAINVDSCRLQKETIDEFLSSQLTRYKNFIAGHNTHEAMMDWQHDEILLDIVRIVVLPAVLGGHDWHSAFHALVDENMSKLNIPDSMIEEVFRNDRLNKKDEEGNFYPWYQPADFSKHLSQM